MRRSAGALLLIALVLCGAFLRARLAPRATALPASKRGVVLLVIDGWDARSLMFSTDAVSLRTLAERYPVGLLPTRSGARTEDCAAFVQMLLAGSRGHAPGARTLPDAVTQAGGSFTQCALPACRVPTGTTTPQVLLATADPLQAQRFLERLTQEDGLPVGWSVLVVGATPSPAALARRERVAPVVLWQRDLNPTIPRLLTSPSTRQHPGLIAATDLAATVLALLDLPGDAQRIGDGRALESLPFTPRSGEATPGRFLWRQAERWGLQAREQKLLPMLPWTLAALLAMATLLPSAVLRRATRVTALTLPLALIALAPLVSPEQNAPPYAIYALAGIVATVLAVVAGRSARWVDRLPRLLALATTGIIAGDTLLGGPLLSRTPLSYSVLEAARFYGIGNEVSGIFLGAALVAVGADAGIIATLLCGLAAALVSGIPQLGADAGGFVATLAAFTALAFAPSLRNGLTRKGAFRVLLAGAGIVLVVVLFALWDGGRPAQSRTHIGEAVAAARAHGIGALAAIATRKVGVNARLLVTSPWAVLLYTEAALSVLLAHRRRRRSEPIKAPTAVLQCGLFAAALALFALNDSGVVAASACGLWLFALRSADPPSPADRRQSCSRTCTDNGT